METNYHIAFWNLENLFDIENSPRREDKIIRAIGKDIVGWTQVQLDQKINQLAFIIGKMNNGLGPDLLGVCEVENKYVMDLLVDSLSGLGRNYSVAHHDMSDKRGIDIGIIYDPALFTFENLYSHFVMRRTATRDILQVNFKTQNGRNLVVIGNHWPSRSGGEQESAAYRAIAGETLAYFHERILETLGADTPVIAMGDFNDEPFDPSLTDFALSIRSKTKVINAENSMFYNLMWPHMGAGLGTIYFNNLPNIFDQFLVNKNLLDDLLPIAVLPETAQIFCRPEMTKQGKYPYPIIFGGMGKVVNTEGFSDHFPVCVTLRESY